MLYRDSRGVELPGTVNPAILEENMFRQQTAPWDIFALQYSESTCKALNAFNAKIFEVKISDDDLKQNSEDVCRGSKGRPSSVPRTV